MMIEAAVLGGDHGLDQIRRQLVEPDMAAPQTSLREHRAVGGEDGQVRRPIVERGDHWVGQARDENCDGGAEEHRDPKAAKEKGPQRPGLERSAPQRPALALDPRARSPRRVAAWRLSLKSGAEHPALPLDAGRSRAAPARRLTSRAESRLDTFPRVMTGCLLLRRCCTTSRPTQGVDLLRGRNGREALDPEAKRSRLIHC